MGIKAKLRNVRRRRTYENLRKDAIEKYHSMDHETLETARDVFIGRSEAYKTIAETLEAAVIAGDKIDCMNESAIFFKFEKPAELLMFAGNYSLVLDDLVSAEKCYKDASLLYQKAAKHSANEENIEFYEGCSEETHLNAIAVIYEQRRREKEPRILKFLFDNF